LFIKSKKVARNVPRKPSVTKIYLMLKLSWSVNEGITSRNLSINRPVNDTAAMKTNIGVTILLVLGIKAINGKIKQHVRTAHENVLNGSSTTLLITNPVSSGIFAYQIGRNCENIR
jgi:hypothetical protein